MDRAVESSVIIKPEKWGIQSEKRRKRRRRRRVGFEEENAGAEAEETEAISVPVAGASRSGFLSRLEEVQLCLYLKVYHLLSNISHGTSMEIFKLC